MAFGAFAPMPLRLGGSQKEGWAPTEHARVCADLVAVTRVLPFARFSYTKAGSTVVISGYRGRNGSGPAAKPTVTVNGTGDVTFTWPVSYLDEYEASRQPDFDAAIGRLNGSAGGNVVVQVTANTVRVRTRDTSGTAGDMPVSLQVWGEAGIQTRAIGDYGASPDKRESEMEGSVPYAAQWYHEFQAARGDAYTTKTNTLVHCENLALARLWASWASRFPEKRRANALPHRSDEKLPYWVEVLNVPTRSDDPKWLVRKRCAANFKASRGPSLPVIREVLTELLGSALVDVIQTQGTDLATPPAATFWAGSPGVPSYNLGGGTWSSRRAHLLVEVRRPANQELASFLQLLNVDMQRLLDTMLPAWATFSWVIFDKENGFEGFFLDVSPLDLTGLTES